MSALLLLALAVAISGLHNVLEDITWWFPAFGVAFVVFTAAAVARFYLRRQWAGTVAAFVGGAIILTLFFSADASFIGFIPTGDTVGHFMQLFQAGNDSIERQTLPAFATSGIQFIICLVVAGIALLMDAAANWLRAPALVGVPLLVVCVVPSIIIANLADGFTFELTAIVYLLILLFRGRRIQTPVALISGAIAVLAALVTPNVLPPVAVGGTTGSGLGVLSESVNPIINLGNDLRNSDASAALSYTTTSPSGEYLQMTTLESFAGDQWAPETPALKASHNVHTFGAIPGITTAVKRTRVTTEIQVAGASSPWLPVPYAPLSISGLHGSWKWQDQSLSVRSTSATTQDQRYKVTSVDIEPTIQQLESAPRSPNNPLAKVPKGLDPIVASTAKKVVGNAVTDFDKAIALQKWFTGGTFTYSTRAPKVDGYDGAGLNEIVPFLKKKSGYCVHFATTMAIMARTLGIPSRVAVGFLPGRLTHVGGAGNAVYQVSSSDLHAWPELYFKGIGWVRFEPTPSKGFEPNFPSAPVGPTSAPTSGPTSGPTGAATPPPVKLPKLPNQGGGSSTSAINDTSIAPTAGFGSAGALLAVLVLLLPTFLRIGIRRRRIDQIRQGIDPAGWAWQELRETARDLGVVAPASYTPTRMVEALTACLERRPQRTGAAVEALVALKELVEEESFAPPAYRYNGERMADELLIVLRGLRRASSVRRRIGATVLAPTLVDRVLGRAAATP